MSDEPTLDKVKERISLLEANNKNLDKRIEDLSGLIRIALTIFSMVFAIFAFTGVWSFYAEKADLRDYRNQTTNDIERVLGNLSGLPIIRLDNALRQNLHNSEIDAVLDSGNSNKFDIYFFIKNSGEIKTEPLYIIVYFDDSIKFQRLSADETDFTYAVNFRPNGESISSGSEVIPPGAAYHYRLGFFPVGGTQNLSGKFPAMIKIFYGGERPYIARFTINIRQQ